MHGGLFISFTFRHFCRLAAFHLHMQVPLTKCQHAACAPPFSFAGRHYRRFRHVYRANIARSPCTVEETPIPPPWRDAQAYACATGRPLTSALHGSDATLPRYCREMIDKPRLRTCKRPCRRSNDAARRCDAPRPPFLSSRAMPPAYALLDEEIFSPGPKARAAPRASSTCAGLQGVGFTRRALARLSPALPSPKQTMAISFL